MSGTLENPAIGEPNSTGDPKIVELVKQFNSKLDGSNTFPDSSLTSPNNSAYRQIFRSYGKAGFAASAGTYIMGAYNAEQGRDYTSGSTVQIGIPYPPIFYFDDADYTVAGKTQKLRLRAQIATNATKPAIKFTVGLYPVTSAGGTNQLSLTLGTVVSGSTVEFNEPAASTVTSGVTSDFTIPSDGAYMLGYVTSATLTTNNYSLINAQLQTRST